MCSERNGAPPALWPGTLPLFCFHQVGEDVIDARAVAFTLGLEPSENFRVEERGQRTVQGLRPSGPTPPHWKLDIGFPGLWLHLQFE